MLRYLGAFLQMTKKAANSTVNIEGRIKILHLHLLFSLVLTLVLCTINMVYSNISRAY